MTVGLNPDNADFVRRMYSSDQPTAVVKDLPVTQLDDVHDEPVAAPTPAEPLADNDDADVVVIDDEPPADTEGADPGDRFSSSSPTAPTTRAAPPNTKGAKVSKDNGEDEEDSVNGRTKATLAVLAGLVAVAVVVVIVLVNVLSKDPAPPPVVETQRPAAVSPPETNVPVGVTDDDSLPFEASGDCDTGSTPAASVQASATDQAWTCYGSTLGMGQQFTLDLKRYQVVSAIVVTSGWLAKVPGGREEYSQHRVPTKIRWMFPDDPQGRFVEQDTHGVRGPATVSVPNITTSKIVGRIIQTERPQVEVQPSTPPPSGGGLFGGLFGPDGSDTSGSTQTALPPAPFGGSNQGSDPVDQSFAISLIEVKGHSPNASS